MHVHINAGEVWVNVALTFSKSAGNGVALDGGIRARGLPIEVVVSLVNAQHLYKWSSK